MKNLNNLTLVRVLYRTGGDRHWTWRASLIVDTYQTAKAAAIEIQRGGHRALLVPEFQFQKRGLPWTYNADAVDEYYPRRLTQARWVKP
jgi:hypothetical protein